MLVIAALALFGGEATAGKGGGDRWCPKGERGALETKTLKGLRVKRADTVATAKGCMFRVVKRNGDWLPITKDLRRDRVNVIVRERRVKRIHGVY